VKKRFTIEELELIAPDLAQQAMRHGLKSVSIDELLSYRKEQGGGRSLLSLQDKARAILAGARADLGYDLGGGSKLDLLLDNMPELDSVTSARELLRSIGELGEARKHEQGREPTADELPMVRWAEDLLGLGYFDSEIEEELMEKYKISPSKARKILDMAAGVGETVKKRLPVVEQNVVAASGVADRSPIALRQWMWKPMHLGVDKAPREQVNYRHGLMQGRMEIRNQVCDTCRFLMSGWSEEEEEGDLRVLGRCELVEGNVHEKHVCDLWQPDHLRTSFFLQKIHAAEAAMSGKPYQEHSDAEYVESAMEFIEAGEDPDAVIDFLLNPKEQKQERLRRHYRPDLSRSEMDDLASKLVAQGWDAKSDAPYLITDAPDDAIDSAESTESLKHEQVGMINIDGTTYQVKSWAGTWPPSIETEDGRFWLVAPDAADLPWKTEVVDVIDADSSVARALTFVPRFAQRVPGR